MEKRRLLWAALAILMWNYLPNSIISGMFVVASFILFKDPWIVATSSSVAFLAARPTISVSTTFLAYNISKRLSSSSSSLNFCSYKGKLKLSLMKLSLPHLLSVIPIIYRALNASLTEGREVPNSSVRNCSGGSYPLVLIYPLLLNLELVQLFSYKLF